MKTVIIEDEKSNSKRLIELLKKMEEDFEIISVLESVEESIQWFANNDMPDIVFMDVQLSDGLSFEIFESIEIISPIIFTTAYDEYAIKAFKVNSVDYILKPIDEIELKKSLVKFNKIYKEDDFQSNINISDIIKNLEVENSKFKTRFLLKKGNSFTSLNVENIAYIIVENQLTKLYSYKNEKFILDSFLDDIEKEIDPNEFFRINRQMLININAIDKIVSYQGSRLKLALNPHVPKEVIVSREKVSQFKRWLGR